MTKALLLYFQHQPAKSGAISWSRFFAEIDLGGGTLSFPELETTVRERLHAQVSRYELRVFWRRLDASNSGSATLGEWIRLMYGIELATWPDLPQLELDRAVKVLNDAAEKWHHAGGNWFKIFSSLDSGTLSYNELRQCVRTGFPGLRLRESEMPEKTVQGLWKLLDNAGEIEIPVARFMSFMRKHGAAHSMHRLTEFSKKRRGLAQLREALPEAPERSGDSLRAAVADLEQALNKLFAARGLHSHGSSEGNWSRFFRETDIDGSGRLNYQEFTDAIFQKLGKYLTITQDDIRALWALLDRDMSMEVTERELMLTLYRLELETWPDEDDAAIGETITTLNDALKKRLNSAGNWYKAFNIVDRDGSGRLECGELTALIRDSFHGLAVSLACVSELALKGFWKRLDANLSGDVTVAEFINFVRKHAGQKNSMHRLTSYALKQRGITGPKEIDYSEEIARAPQYDEATMCAVASRLALAVNEWLVSTGVRVDARKPRLWGRFIDAMEKAGTHRANFREFLRGARNMLRVVHDDGDAQKSPSDEVRGQRLLSEVQLMAFWRVVDIDGSGEASAMEFDKAVYRLQLQTWPKLEEMDLQRIVSAMNTAADKWHRASGNWYKVCKACDADGSGNLTSEDLFEVVRKSFPGLSIPAKVISDQDLRGIWRAVDDDCSGLVDTKEFMVFMRMHGSQHSMNRLTEYTKKKRGVNTETQQELGQPPEKSRDELREISRSLNDALASFWRRKGVTIIGHPEMWERFFVEGDTCKIGKLSFFELEAHMRATLPRSQPKQQAGPSSDAGSTPDGEFPAATADDPSLDPPEDKCLAKGVKHTELLALWCATVRIEGFNEVSAHDWCVALYRLELEAWEQVDDETIASVVHKISSAAHKWYRAGGNWYKIFRLVDTDESGRLGFQEFVDIIRRPLPCLAVTEKQLRDRDLKGLWKALDTDRSGDVDVSEFMCFMRRWEVGRGLSHTPTAMVHSARRASQEAEKSRTRRLSAEESKMFNQSLGALSASAVREAYELWGLPWDGLVSEWDFLRLVRDLLGLATEALDDDAVHTAWCSLDASCEGKVSVNAMLGLGS